MYTNVVFGTAKTVYIEVSLFQSVVIEGSTVYNANFVQFLQYPVLDTTWLAPKLKSDYSTAGI